MDENELFFFYFDRNIINYDRDYHDELKVQDDEYVNEKFHVPPEDIPLFNQWVATNPENIYNLQGILSFCHQQWLDRREVFRIKELEVFGNLYVHRIRLLSFINI